MILVIEVETFSYKPSVRFYESRDDFCADVARRFPKKIFDLKKKEDMNPDDPIIDDGPGFYYWDQCIGMFTGGVIEKFDAHKRHLANQFHRVYILETADAIQMKQRLLGWMLEKDYSEPWGMEAKIKIKSMLEFPPFNLIPL